MDDSVALRRYRQRYIEAGLPENFARAGRWRQVLVLPAYRESPALLDTLRQSLPRADKTLVIVVLNRPDADTDTAANESLRSAIRAGQPDITAPHALMSLGGHNDLLLLDLEQARGATPSSQGVGLARKAGCDLALDWMAQGAITGEWICCTDADAVLPDDYFQRLEAYGKDAVAAVFPFRHVPGGDDAIDRATALYELRLHHHVLGLEHAGSPYDFHCLGSCLAVRADAYARVRGFPRRAGAEDFYLLNKLAKLGPITRPPGASIKLRSRLSSRVPFGTGPAVKNIASAERPEAERIFYHPLCYTALRMLLEGVDDLAQQPGADSMALFNRRGLAPAAAEPARDALEGMGLQHALAHCRRQGKSPGGFQRHFHQWFDGFLTLKFIHALRDNGWPLQSLAQLETLEPVLWPTPGQDIDSLSKGITAYRGWL